MPFRLNAAFVLALLGPCQLGMAANNYPIVLVHGFLGFGPEQFKASGFKYWGGFDDIIGHMRQHQGQHQVFEATVGAVSSSWDRSAELYYQIKGGCVDYGLLYATRSGHASGEARPPGQCWAADPANNPQHYPLALYPAWDAGHPIHLIGHSQGGQTIRALIQLLEQGSPHGDEGGGALYQGGKLGWVTSATTLSAPHDGTSLHDAIGDFGLLATDLASQIAAIASPGQGPQRAVPRWNSDNYDSVQYEMGPDGAHQFNSWVKTSPLVYYFSIANSATERGAFCCNNTDRFIAFFQNPQYHYARWDMAPLTKPYAGEWIMSAVGRRGLGSYTQSAPGRVQVDARWFENDGVVNTSSMRAPSGQPVRDFDGTPVQGSWNFLHTYHGYDHFDMVGWPRKGEQVYPLYDAVAAIIFAL
ncbi:MAG: hypothetical protein V4484_08270 [Pseudomonadota bacterium]